MLLRWKGKTTLNVKTRTGRRRRPVTTDSNVWEHIEKQTDSHQCGIYTIEFMQQLAFCDLIFTFAPKCTEEGIQKLRVDQGSR